MSRCVTAGALVLLLAGPAGSQESPQHDTPEITREQEADQKAAVAGEAPASEHRQEDAAEEAIQVPTDSAAPGRAQAAARRDALQHLGRIETIVLRLLEEGAAHGEAPVGTRGTPVAGETGEMMAVPRTRLEEIRVHLEQLRTALEKQGNGRYRD